MEFTTNALTMLSIYGIQYLITQKSLECSIEIGGIFLCVTSVGLFICFVIFPAQGLPETSSNEPQKCHKHSFLSPLPKQQTCPRHSFFNKRSPQGLLNNPYGVAVYVKYEGKAFAKISGKMSN